MDAKAIAKSMALLEQARDTFERSQLRNLRSASKLFRSRRQLLQSEIKLRQSRTLCKLKLAV
jgi:hypothetical protein